MKKIFLLGLMLMLGINTGFSQNILGNMTMSATPPEGYRSPKKDSAKVKINAASQSQKTGRLYDIFEYSSEIHGKFACVNQGDHIKQGDTFRIKCGFDPRCVFGVRVIKGYSGKQPIASPRNLMKGEWIAEVKPEKSTEVVLEIETPIKGILNFAPVVLTVPEEVEVRNVDLSVNLEVLSYNIETIWILSQKKNNIFITILQLVGGCRQAVFVMF
jgi:hypothetical protein